MIDSGNIDNIKGKTKEVIGKETADKGTQSEGILIMSSVKCKESSSNVKDNAKDF